MRRMSRIFQTETPLNTRKNAKGDHPENFFSRQFAFLADISYFGSDSHFMPDRPQVVEDRLEKRFF
jgi:hypothetical protein